MALNKNIFYATNPAHMLDALWEVVKSENIDLQDILIFLPSRRAVRSVERFFVEKSGHSIILPKLVALGEGFQPVSSDKKIISNVQRLVILAKLLAADASIGNIASALPIAHDLLQLQDYLENEGVSAAGINWGSLIDEKFALHFQRKASLLNILSELQYKYLNDMQTEVQVRNQDIRDWINHLDEYKLIIVCGSTASVPATADLMVAIAKKDNGRIILSGKIAGSVKDFLIDSNPYNSEYKFLSRLKINYEDLQPIDVGNSPINFFNYVFSNNTDRLAGEESLSNCHLVECMKEAEEAEVVAEIAQRAIQNQKSVLVITPDAAANQRISAALKARKITADFSSGISGTMTAAGRAVLNFFDSWIEQGNTYMFDKYYTSSNYDLFKTIVKIVDVFGKDFEPIFDFSDVVAMQIWAAIKDLSDCLNNIDLHLSLFDAKALLADVIANVTVRGVMDDCAKVVVLGTIESRMQTADVVVLTGLNEGMFPARGYENDWLPIRLAKEIGLPPPDRKVSLQALDFMNLSCGKEVYWLRSRISGGVQTIESRFLSRVYARFAGVDLTVGQDLLKTVREKDNLSYMPLDYSDPVPPADWSDVYVTELELLIHNPYAFYVRHILRLYPKDDYWVAPDARQFGNLVHDVIENSKVFLSENLVKDMDKKAMELLGIDSVLFHFWHKRFLEIAPIVAKELSDIKLSVPEILGGVNINGRNIKARADRIWDGGVLDIKTGAAPSDTQLYKGNMPQLPLEAYILQQNGFPIRTTEKSKTPVMMFLQLKNNDVQTIKYDTETTAKMISAAVEKTKELINIFSVGMAPYEYRENTDRKYKIYDDFARRDD